MTPGVTARQGLLNLTRLGASATAAQAAEGVLEAPDVAFAVLLVAGASDDAAQPTGQNGTDLVSFIRWKYINNTVYRLSRRICMQCRKHQMTGFRNRYGCLHRFKIPHLTDKHDIWIFTQNTAKGDSP